MSLLINVDYIGFIRLAVALWASVIHEDSGLLTDIFTTCSLLRSLGAVTIITPSDILAVILLASMFLPKRKLFSKHVSITSSPLWIFLPPDRCNTF